MAHATRDAPYADVSSTTCTWPPPIADGTVVSGHRCEEALFSVGSDFCRDTF